MGGSKFTKKYRRVLIKLKKIQQKHWIVLSILSVALVFILVAILITRKANVSQFVDTDVSNENEMIRDALTGLLVYEQNMPRQVYGVMIDNHVDARPQSGIDKAFLVIEAPVEGNISRLLAFFSEGQEVKKIGPVRSARPYFIDWNNELDALYVHVGGSDQSLDEIASGGTFDLNQYWNDSYFWRTSFREAPHNVYISTEELKSFSDARKEVGRAPKLLYGIWKFKDPEKNIPNEPKGLLISFYSPEYVVSWEYDKQENRYKRLQRGKLDKTLDGSQIFSDNIAVVIIDIETIDSVGRKQIDTIGKGKGYVFQDGNIIEGSWKKNSESERLRFYDKDDEEIVFNGGSTWIEVVSSEESLTIK